MGSEIVSKGQLDILKKNCELCIIDLRKAIKDYCDNADEMSKVVENLKKFYDTEGGKYKVKEINNIDISGEHLKEIIKLVDSIDISYNVITTLL